MATAGQPNTTAGCCEQCRDEDDGEPERGKAGVSPPPQIKGKANEVRSESKTQNLQLRVSCTNTNTLMNLVGWLVGLNVSEQSLRRSFLRFIWFVPGN